MTTCKAFKESVKGVHMERTLRSFSVESFYRHITSPPFLPPPMLPLWWIVLILCVQSDGFFPFLLNPLPVWGTFFCFIINKFVYCSICAFEVQDNLVRCLLLAECVCMSEAAKETICCVLCCFLCTGAQTLFITCPLLCLSKISLCCHIWFLDRTLSGQPLHAGRCEFMSLYVCMVTPEHLIMPKLSESLYWLSKYTEPLSERQQDQPWFFLCSLLFVWAVCQCSTKAYTLKEVQRRGI